MSFLGRPGAARSAAGTVVLTAAALVLAACGSTASGTDAAVSPSASPTAASPTTASTTGAAATTPVTVSDTWVKSADSGMTAMFGMIKNTGSTDVTVVSATSDAAEMLELHEVVMVDGAMKMQPKKGGFTIPAGGTHELKPGGDHVMFMGLKNPVKAGDPVTVVLTLADGSTVTVNSVGKDFTGANESYQPTPSGSMSSGM
ncbi:MAG: copper chaperone PCu(A)C [Actinobacteria bacterium]|nr:copper chaperone PCu(A)C [Actinomycetota bacterium]